MAKFDSDTNGKTVVETLANDVKGKTFLITGPSAGGIGAETAISLASGQPKRIILAGRSEAKINPVIKQIKETNSSIETMFVQIDLSNNSSVQDAAKTIDGSVDKLDVLINCAGVMAVADYTKSADGFEIQFAANHLGHFLLTNLLMSKIIAARGMIINVSSGGYINAEVNFEDPNFEGGKTYNPWAAYGQSKTANILFSVALVEKFKAKGVSSLAVNPGLILESQLQTNTAISAELFQEGYKMAVARNDGKEPTGMVPKTLQNAAAVVLAAALDKSLRGKYNDYKAPAYITECEVMPTKEYAHSKTNAEKLWKMSERMVGQKFDE